jgi:biopolymer transport protein ExbB
LLLGLGGPVVLILLALSMLALSVIFYKIWDLRTAGVGRHQAITQAIAAFDGARAQARERCLVEQEPPRRGPRDRDRCRTR